MFIYCLRRFDGWFINIETALPSAESTNTMRDFVRVLTQKTHERIPNSLVIWYDSVVTTGHLQWQNQLNEQNKVL